MGEQEEAGAVAETIAPPEAEPEPEPPKHVVTRADLEAVKASPRSTIRRKLIDVPEWGEGLQVWAHGVSELERQVADLYAAPEGKRDMALYQEAMIAASLRDSDADAAAPLFEVPGPDNGKLTRMDWHLFQRLFNEVMELDLGSGLAARVMEAMEDFRKAEGTPS